MTPRERWLAVLRREKPDRLPMDYWGTEEATRRVMEHLRCAIPWEMYEKLHIDKAVDVQPAYIGPPLPPDHDEYGCRYELVDYGTGRYKECVGHPLAHLDTIEAIEKHYTWPTPDWYDYSTLPAQLRGKERYVVRGGGSEPFLTYCYLRGLEQAYIDLAIHAELVEYCLDKLFGFCYENTRRIYEQLPGKVDLSYVAEDFGSQEDLLMSPQIIREMFVPRMKRVIDLVHSAGCYAFFHSDGAVRKILPDMVAAGIDILNPIQWRCRGMDRAELKSEFGGRVVFHGGIDNQKTLAFGTTEDVRREVLDSIEILGKGGGYIIAPCHNVQALTPPENVLALYETGRNHGWQ
ncbi:MAG: uroporphyrinogen decarboxylase family protein [Planctomycetota bacterium]